LIFVIKFECNLIFQLKLSMYNQLRKKSMQEKNRNNVSLLSQIMLYSYRCIMKVNVVSIWELWSLSAAILDSLLGELCEIRSHSQIVFLLGASFMGLAPWPCQVRDCPLAKLNLRATNNIFLLLLTNLCSVLLLRLLP
jgi:hypothetical protein